MANDIKYNVVVTDKGLEITVKGVEKLGKVASNTTKKVKETANAANELDYKLNQGITGVSSAARSFSKLNQAIGQGPNGLVGAYATLAANIFAVSAAFNALRSAQQAEMVLQGLEAQGARTGRALGVAAQELREVLKYGISAQESMQATAMFTATGFTGEELKKLGEVALNTSLALGRNLPDSLDRLIKGTTKLEPELLDELGIMTKLGEATAAYALKTGKSEASLSQFERRQAFLNAVLTEGEVKFKGISDSVDTNPYDKLAASFDNLTKATFGLINDSGLLDFVNYLSENTTALIGVILLFASTIRGQLLGSLATMSETAVSAAKAAKQEAENVQELTAARIAEEKALARSNLARAANINISEKSAKSLRQNKEAILAGTLSTEEIDKLMATNQRSINAHTGFRNRDADKGLDVAAREETIKTLTEQQHKLEVLKVATAAYTDESIRMAAEQKTANAVSAASAQSRAYEARATAIQALSNNDLATSYRALTVSTAAYSEMLAIETLEKRASAAEGGRLAAANLLLTETGNKLKVGMFAAGTALQAIGTTFIKFIPYLGIAAIAWDMLSSLFESFYSMIYPKTAKAYDELTKTLEKTTEVTENTTKAYEGYNKILDSSASSYMRTIEATKNRTAALSEQTDALVKLIEKELEYQKIKKEEDLNTPSFGMNLLLSAQPEAAGAYYQVMAQEAKKSLTSQEKWWRSLKSTIAGFELEKESSDQLYAGLENIDKYLQTIGSSVKQRFKEANIAVNSSEESLQGMKKVLKAVGSEQMEYQASINATSDAFSEADKAANKFLKSLVGTSAFDTILEQFQNLNKSLRDSKAGVSSKEFSNLLLGASKDVQLFLNPKDASLIETFKAVNAEYTNLKSQEKDLGFLGQTRMEILENILASQTEYNQRLRDSYRQAELDLLATKEKVVLAKAQIDLENTRFSKLSSYLSIGAAGFRAQLEHEEKIRDLQAVELKAQKAILDAKMAQINAEISKATYEFESLKRQQEELKNQEAIRKSKIEQNKIFVEQLLLYETLLDKANKLNPAWTTTAEQRIKSTGFGGLNIPTEFLPDRLKSESQLKADEAASKAAKEAEKASNARIANVKNTIADLKVSSREIDIASRLLGSQIDALYAAALTPAQIQGKENLAKAEQEFTEIQRRLESEKTTREAKFEQRRASIIGKGLAAELELELNIIRERGEAERSDLIATEKARQEVSVRRMADAMLMRDQTKNITSTEREAISATIADLADINTKEAQNTTSKLLTSAAQENINIAQAVGLTQLTEQLELVKKWHEELIKILDVTNKFKLDELNSSLRERDSFANLLGVTRDRSVEKAKLEAQLATDTYLQRKSLIDLEYDLLNAQYRQEKELIDVKLREQNISAETRAALERTATSLAEIINKTDKITTDSSGNITSGSARSSAQGSLAIETIDKEQAAIWAEIGKYTSTLIENFKKLGPGGEAAIAVFQGMENIRSIVIDSMENIDNATNQTAAKIAIVADAIAQAIGTVIAITSAAATAKEAAVQREIDAEEKRDGKSAQSVAKLAALEKKKEQIAKKQFNLNKKLMIAQAVMSTAAGVAGTLAHTAELGPVAAAILAGVIGAMGAAQIALIAGTSYEGTSKTAATVSAPAYSVGKRSDTVDLARGPNASAGGEAGFISGSRGFGSNASNYQTIGSAYGGRLDRGYGNRGFIVGEKGPEMISPEVPITVTPNDKANNTTPLNANINIQAIDAKGVKEMLLDNRGNIISMLREAANASGQGFMEDVNVSVYTNPSVSRV